MVGIDQHGLCYKCSRGCHQLSCSSWKMFETFSMFPPISLPNILCRGNGGMDGLVMFVRVVVAVVHDYSWRWFVTRFPFGWMCLKGILRTGAAAAASASCCCPHGHRKIGLCELVQRKREHCREEDSFPFRFDPMDIRHKHQHPHPHLVVVVVVVEGCLLDSH